MNLVSIFRCSSPPHNPVYTRRVDPSGLVFSLSSHRYSYIHVFYLALTLSIHNKPVKTIQSSIWLSFYHLIINNLDTRPETYCIYPLNPVYVRCLDPSVLSFSLSLYRHPSMCILFTFRLDSYNKHSPLVLCLSLTPTPSVFLPP